MWGFLLASVAIMWLALLFLGTPVMSTSQLGHQFSLKALVDLISQWKIRICICGGNVHKVQKEGALWFCGGPRSLAAAGLTGKFQPYAYYGQCWWSREGDVFPYPVSTKLHIPPKFESKVWASFMESPS